MFRHLRIAILPLIAAAVMPSPYGMADGIGSKPQISTARPLIRVADQQCRRECDSDFAACTAQMREYVRQAQEPVPEADFMGALKECEAQHRACYATCQ